ncbi:FHA domain-containing protein [Dactylosporangium sp. AC04546]|uniref:FHA domain-containing protein n=1 Tax=Dactylosporangium sp. AC04546 TaxID=2862460 RepID=UPI001EDFCBA2|nr:FHA domain-containing protein [Dactylosporangium sp. AC04546]WVK88161.1 FHA domain-containing protein [Dactylosporangium sp. AC04546]
MPGAGLVTRAGALLAVAEPAGAEELLTLVRRIAADGGDGPDLVRRVAELFPAGELSCAVAGPTADGDLAVLVCGHATAEVDGRHEQVRLTGPGPATRVVAGPVAAVRLTLPGAGAPHPLARLDGGVVGGAGLSARFHTEPAPPPKEPAPPFEAVLLVPGYAPPLAPVEPVADTEVLVEGVDCKNGHFNDPALRYCQRCGIAMHQLTLVSRLGPRPPLGVLLLDNGMTLRADADYVVGRDPARDPDVAAGRARPLRIADSYGGISRRHLRVKLSGWTVRVVDLGSANGTYVQGPGADEAPRVPAGGAVEVRPGAKIIFGRRWLRYESHRNP